MIINWGNKKKPILPSDRQIKMCMCVCVYVCTCKKHDCPIFIDVNK